MEKFKTDQEKPLWWIMLVISLMVFIYFIGITAKIDTYTNEANQNLVENLNGPFR